jgi:F-type H+-transporting ATPase subunit b
VVPRNRFAHPVEGALKPQEKPIADIGSCVYPGGNVVNFTVTFFIMIFNLTLLYLLMRHFLFKPVTNFMENRTNKVQNDIDAAKRARTHAEELQAEYEAKLRDIQADGQKILQAARQRAETESADIVGKARDEAAEIIKAGRLAVEEERRIAEQRLRTQTADLTILAASRVLQENLDTVSNRKIVDRFLESVGAA